MTVVIQACDEKSVRFFWSLKKGTNKRDDLALGVQINVIVEIDELELNKII